MRQITSCAWSAFYGGYDFNRGNTRVVINGDTRTMYLHNTAIAKYRRGRLTIQTGGWNTATTKERLNGSGWVKVTTCRGQLYLNGEPWSGKTHTLKINNL